MTISELLALGLQYHNTGHFAEAEQIYQQVLAVEPNQIDATHLLGVVALQTGNFEIAAGHIRRALDLKPDWAEAHGNLGAALHYQGKPHEALDWYLRAIELKPDFADAYANAGKALTDLGKLDDAAVWFQRALQVKPDHAAAYNNWAVLLQKQGKLDEAANCCRWAVQLQPNYADAHFNLGNALRDQGKLDDAIACYRRAVELQPRFAEAHNNLGNALYDQRRSDEATVCYRRAVELNPAIPEAHNNLGNALKDEGDLDKAVACYRRALQLSPDFADAHNNLGNALKDQGELDAAVDCFRRAMQLNPASARAHSNLICTLYYCPHSSAETIGKELRRWTLQHAVPTAEQIRSHSNDRSPDRRLRLGYVSPDFRDHVVGRNVWPWLRNHDHDQFEIYLYANRTCNDWMSDQFRGSAEKWCSITVLTDEQAAEKIRQDRIDILVDLAVHTAGNRLLVFARKPAPVQVSFAGYPGSTGLAAIDYRLTDPYLDPPAEQGSKTPGPFSAEELHRLPHTFWCYDPLTEEPTVAPLPSLKMGFITFGCLNNFCKINATVLELWARVLRAVNGSRLILLAKEGSHRQRTLDSLAQLGIAPERVEFSSMKPRPDYLALYHQIDIGLDTFPYNGHTTSLDSYWMGVPVITLVGSMAVGRAGLSQLTNLGLEELAARTPEDFVRIAVQLAGDLPRLNTLREGLRKRMRQSPLMDASGFARDIEAAYREMWRRWCQH
jgi:predicted O-linked N-acetylglucosamine transferase (SPINDLY family)